jgi:hypothetical protein
VQKEVAKRIIDLMIEFGEQLDALRDHIRNHASPEEFDRYRRVTGKIIGTMFTEGIAPLFSEHPDLVPGSISSKIDPARIDWTQEPSGVRSKSFVPRDKFDLKRADMLESLDQTALQQIAPDLLVWIQDMNWPVAGRVAKALAGVGQPIVPLLQEVLRGTDDTWKRSCVQYVITDLPAELAVQLRPELSRIANAPSEGEVEEEVADVAREALEQLP